MSDTGLSALSALRTQHASETLLDAGLCAPCEVQAPQWAGRTLGWREWKTKPQLRAGAAAQGECPPCPLQRRVAVPRTGPGVHHAARLERTDQESSRPRARLLT